MPNFQSLLLTLFPEIFPGPLGFSVAGSALKAGLWSCDTINIKDYGLGKHKQVDDTPYGGGAGMVMRADVLGSALEKAKEQMPDANIYYPSPRGQVFNQKLAHEIVSEKKIIMLCGRFEGIDERVIEEYDLRQVSLGDYVLSAGEIAAFAMLDACIRLIPGVLGNPDSAISESFQEGSDFAGMLEPPLYTKPSIWRGREAPAALRSGNHGLIKKWKQERSAEITRQLRPDLYKIK